MRFGGLAVPVQWRPHLDLPVQFARREIAIDGDCRIPLVVSSDSRDDWWGLLEVKCAPTTIRMFIS
jgi:hypothetical protein